MKYHNREIGTSSSVEERLLFEINKEVISISRRLGFNGGDASSANRQIGQPSSTKSRLLWEIAQNLNPCPNAPCTTTTTTTTIGCVLYQVLAFNVEIEYDIEYTNCEGDIIEVKMTGSILICAQIGSVSRSEDWEVTEIDVCEPDPCPTSYWEITNNAFGIDYDVNWFDDCTGRTSSQPVTLGEPIQICAVGTPWSIGLQIDSLGPCP
jgi:hypothetical protein